MHAYVYVCAYMRVQVHVYLYVYVYMYVCVHVCCTSIYTRVWVYICTRVGAYCLFVLSNLFTTCACISLLTPVCMCVGGLDVGFFPACSWLVVVAGVGGYALTEVEIGVLSCIFLYFCGC